MTGQIVIVGSLNMDLVVRTPRHPLPGETLLGSEFGTFPGGKGANQAVAAARQGATVIMIGRIGKDSFGKTLRQTLQHDGIDTHYLLEDDHAASGVALITVDAAGQNTIIVAPGANGALHPDDVLAAEMVFQGAAAIILQLEVPLPVVLQAAQLGQRLGARVILNAAPAQHLETALLQQVDDLIVNETELAIIARLDDLASAVEQLRGQGVRRVVVTLGERGAVLVDDEGTTSVPAHRVAVVDTTAAGDAFAGAYVVALAEGQSARSAVARGVAAGAITITRAGAQPSIPTRAEVDALLDKG